MVCRERIAQVFEKEGATEKALAQYQSLIDDYPEREQIYRKQIEKLTEE